MITDLLITFLIQFEFYFGRWLEFLLVCYKEQNFLSDLVKHFVQFKKFVFSSYSFAFGRCSFNSAAQFNAQYGRKYQNLAVSWARSEDVAP